MRANIAKLVPFILLLASPAWSQTNLVPKAASTGRVDNCAPIGQTADRKLVYSMKCENLPQPPPSQAEAREAVPPEPEAQRGGVFGWSYDRR